MSDNDLQVQIDNLKRQLILAEEKNKRNLARVSAALVHMRGATARLMDAECNMKGIPEPKMGNEN